MTKSTRLCSDLKEGEKFEIAGIEMQFDGWFQAHKHPVFRHYVNGVPYNYYNRKYTRETPINQLK